VNRLEERYRVILRLLPAAYRRDWEDDMVAAFLDSMDSGDLDDAEYLADYGRPSLSEVASIVSLAVRLRLGGAETSPRTYAWGQAVRLATLMATLTNAVMVTAGIAVTLWLSGKITWLPTPASEWAFTPPTSIWHSAWNLAGYAWLPAYLALVFGHQRVAQAVALVAIVPPLITTVVEQTAGNAPLSVAPWALRIVDVLVLIAMAAFHSGAPQVRRRPWLLALPVGVLLVPAPLFALQLSAPTLRLLDWPGLSCAVVTAAMVVYLTVRVARRPSGALPWTLAFNLLAAVVLALRIATLPDYHHQGQRTALTTIASVEAVAVLAVGVPLAVLAVRALRRLPSIPARTQAP
jgi:hypothetical protein